MSVKKVSRKVHKWISLLLSAQFFLWVVTGLYMVIIPIEYIHGDHLVRPVNEALKPKDLTNFSLAQLRADNPDMVNFEIFSLLGTPYVRVIGDGERLINLKNSEVRPSFDADTIRQLATLHYNGDAEITDITLLDKAPSELRGRPTPLWRVSFDDGEDGTLYFSSQTGQLLGKRHFFWRAYDFLWMFHIMDYDTRDNVNNMLLRVITVIALLGAISGAFLAYFSLKKKANKNLKTHYGMNQKTFRTLHKWLSIVIGLQLVIWTGTGSLMALIDQKVVKGTDIAAGVPFERLSPAAPTLIEPTAVLNPLDQDIYRLSLSYAVDRYIYNTSTSEGPFSFDAETGNRFSITEDLARTLAHSDYKGDGELVELEKVDAAPVEAREATTPLWKATFDDERQTRLYFSQTTGRLENRYNDTTGIFDILWMLHMMDYEKQHNFNSGLIITIALCTFWLMLSGILLLFGVFRRKDFQFFKAKKA